MALSILAGLTGAIIAHVSQSDKELDANASAISHAITLNARAQREDMNNIKDAPDEQLNKLESTTRRVDAILKETPPDNAMAVLCALLGQIVAHTSKDDEGIKHNVKQIASVIGMNAKATRENNDQH